VSEPIRTAADTDAKVKRMLAMGGSFFCAGIGQFIQGQWLAGLIYLVTFLGSMGVFIWAMWRTTVGYRANFNAGQELISGDVGGYLIISVASALLAIFIWIVSLIHTARTAKTQAAATGKQP
jgi:TM2 domain-containing membrane protein YozV